MASGMKGLKAPYGIRYERVTASCGIGYERVKAPCGIRYERVEGTLWHRV